MNPRPFVVHLYHAVQNYTFKFEGETIMGKLDGKVAVITGGTSGIGAASMLKTVPILGTIVGGLVMPALSAGATYAIGRAFIQHFASGGTLLDFNPPDYREFVKSQKEMWDSRSKKSSAASASTGASVTSP